MKQLFIICFIFFLAPTTVSAAMPTPTPVPNVSYDLPYPGLLPNSPLYFLKAIRDNVIGLFISDPLEKAKFDLLQADKRINATQFLINDGDTNQQQIISTMGKAENYFDESVQETLQARQQGENITIFANQLSLASRKHIQLLTGMEQHTTPQIKQAAEQNITRVQSYEKTADMYSHYKQQ